MGTMNYHNALQVERDGSIQEHLVSGLNGPQSYRESTYAYFLDPICTKVQRESHEVRFTYHTMLTYIIRQFGFSLHPFTFYVFDGFLSRGSGILFIIPDPNIPKHLSE